MKKLCAALGILFLLPYTVGHSENQPPQLLVKDDHYNHDSDDYHHYHDHDHNHYDDDGSWDDDDDNWDDHHRKKRYNDDYDDDHHDHDSHDHDHH